MSGRVDVLAVMEDAERAAFYASESAACAMREARAAVAELIESAERAYAVLGVDDESQRKGAQRALRVAIARVKGVQP